MTEKQVFGLKPTSRLEQVGDKHSERVRAPPRLRLRGVDRALLVNPDAPFNGGG